MKAASAKLAISFGVLFGIPLILNMGNATLTQLTPRLAFPKDSEFLLGVLNFPQDPELAFLSDLGTLLLAGVLFPVHTVLMVELWKSIENGLDSLVKGRVISLTTVDHKSLCLRYNRLFNVRTWNLLAFALAAFFSMWIVQHGRTDIAWWGGVAGGPVGLASFVLLAMFVFYQLFLHNHKGIVAILLTRELLASAQVRPNPLHEDGCFGFACVVRCCLLSLATTIIHSLGLLVLVRFGYVEKLTGTFFLILVGTVVVFTPLFFIYPLLLIRRCIQDYVYKALREIRSAADQHLDRELTPVAERESLEFLQAAAGFADQLRGWRNLPFTRLKVSLIAAGYAIQLTAALTALKGIIE